MSNDTPPDAKRFLALAKEAAEAADKSEKSGDRLLLLIMAAAYQRLADKVLEQRSPHG